jgi:uncharacterized membrane protein YdjX (TVP38/TMEM64 family)
LNSSVDQDKPAPAPARAPARLSIRRLWPLLLIVAIAAVVLATGTHRHLSFETLARHHGEIRDFIGAHQVAAVLAYAGLYIIVVALSIPGGLFLTLAGGMLFGGLLGGAVTVVSATIGATIIFLIARSALGEHLARRAGPMVDRVARGFVADAFNYLLFLRLVPVFPFWLVNLVPALAGVRLGTFVVATFVGIIPGTFAYAFVGSGLESVIAAQGVDYRACLAAGRADCRFDFHVKSVVTPELIAALVLLGIVALIPVVVKRIRARSRAANVSG